MVPPPGTRTATRTTTSVPTDEQEDTELQDVTYKSNLKKKKLISTQRKITGDRAAGRRPGRPTGTTNAVMEARRRAEAAEKLAQAQTLRDAAQAKASQPQGGPDDPNSVLSGSRKLSHSIEFASPSTMEQVATFRKSREDIAGKQHLPKKDTRYVPLRTKMPSLILVLFLAPRRVVSSTSNGTDPDAFIGDTVDSCKCLLFPPPK
jgi:hypothetical protein